MCWNALNGVIMFKCCLLVLMKEFICFLFSERILRYPSWYEHDQWDKALHSNAFSHWLNPDPEWSIWILYIFGFFFLFMFDTGIILCMRPANERRRYCVTSSLICWAHSQNDPCWHIYCVQFMTTCILTFITYLYAMMCIVTIPIVYRHIIGMVIRLLLNVCKRLWINSLKHFISKWFPDACHWCLFVWLFWTKTT